MIGERSRTAIRRRALKRAGKIGVLEAQKESRDTLEEAVAGYTALRAATGPVQITTDVELRDGTVVTALVRIDLVPKA